VGTNRKQPFGYKMEQGRVVINAVEERWILHLYQKYSLGETIRELTAMMNGTGVYYDIDKPWNKNMVARMLGDVRYTGEQGWPQIIKPELFAIVAEKKSKRAPSVQKTEARTILRRKCDKRITPHIEQEVLYLLNSLASDPGRIIIPSRNGSQLTNVTSLKEELEEILEQLPVDEDKSKRKLQEVAAAMYEAIDPGEYESCRLCGIFGKETPRDTLDARLIGQTISAVLVDSNGRVRIKLKNKQVIERGE